MAERHDPAPRDPARPDGAGTPADAWPASVAFGKEGLSIGGAAVADLTRRFGTPLIIVDEEELRERCRHAAACFPRTLYAVKAFTAHAAIRIALDQGLDLLASTGGEVEACLRAGGPAERIVLHGNNKSDDELALAVGAGLSLVVVDGIEELERLDRFARSADRVQPVLLRVVPGIEVRTHEAIATGQEASKFGIALSEVEEAARTAMSLPGLRFDGLHGHLGSQIQEVGPYRAEVDVLMDLTVKLRDVGSRLGPWISAAGSPPPTSTIAVWPWRRSLPLSWAGLRSGVRPAGLTVPTVIAEPGRGLVAVPAMTVYTVGARKRAGGRTLVAVDGGMSDNLRPMLYDARHAVALANRRSEGDSERASIVGRHCESGDVLAEDVPLPTDLRRGDLLAVGGTGAYAYSLANNYNRVGRPAVVGVREGWATLWLRREDAADMDRLETAAHRPRPRILDLPGDVQVRPARPRDAAAFVTFWAAIVAEARFVRSERVAHPARVYRRRFRRAWTDDEAQIMAMTGARVVGHLFVQRERHPVTHHVASLGIAVAADRRGEGIGSVLMAEAMRWAHEVGVEKFVLSVYPHNTAAIALYRSFGFVDEGRLARQSRKSYGYDDEVLMGAWIGPAPEPRSDLP